MSQIRRMALAIAITTGDAAGENSSECEFRRSLKIAQRSAYGLLACLEIGNKLRY